MTLNVTFYLNQMTVLIIWSVFFYCDVQNEINIGHRYVNYIILYCNVKVVIIVMRLGVCHSLNSQ